VGVSTGDQNMAVETMKRVRGFGWVNLGEVGLTEIAAAVDLTYGGVKARL
jgi:hypothetical protein